MNVFIISLYAFYLFYQPPLSAAEIPVPCYYSGPFQRIDENFFQKLNSKSYDEEETFASVETYFRENIPFCHRFQFKYPLKDSVHAQVFAKVMQIKAQEAHRFVPIICSSQFIAPSHLGFLREIKIANEGPRVQEHVLVDQTATQIIFIEEWTIDTNNIVHPGSFAAINRVIEEEGKWYFAGTYLYSKAPNLSEIPNIICMFQTTYENMMSFIEYEYVDNSIISFINIDIHFLIYYYHSVE